MRAGRILATGFVALAGLIAVGAAGAAPAERLGCPAGYDLMTVDQINLTLTTPDFEDAVSDFDAQGTTMDIYVFICSPTQPLRTHHSTL